MQIYSSDLSKMIASFLNLYMKADFVPIFVLKHLIFLFKLHFRILNIVLYYDSKNVYFTSQLRVNDKNWSLILFVITENQTITNMVAIQ